MARVCVSCVLVWVYVHHKKVEKKSMRPLEQDVCRCRMFPKYFNICVHVQCIISVHTQQRMNISYISRNIYIYIQIHRYIYIYTCVMCRSNNCCLSFSFSVSNSSILSIHKNVRTQSKQKEWHKQHAILSLDKWNNYTQSRNHKGRLNDKQYIYT